MLVTTYNPASQAQCPECKKLVHCENTGGFMMGSKPYLDFYHQECGTKWRLYYNHSETKILEDE